MMWRRVRKRVGAKRVHAENEDDEWSAWESFMDE
jgi:hypothetical protein